MKIADVTHLIVHHSLTKDNVVLSDFEAIKRYHINTNGWSDIGYHFIIEEVAGEVVIREGRALTTVGAHCKEQKMNYRSWGVCIVGNFDNEAPKQKLLTALIELVKRLNKEHNKQLIVEPHTKYATYKSCPGRKFPMEYVVNQIYKPEPAKEWQEKELDMAVADGRINSPDYWKERWNDNIKTKDVVGIVLKLTRKEG